MKWLLIILALFAGNLCAKEYGSVTVLEVTSIYDADTFRVNIVGWPPIIGERDPIRLKGVDAPEIKGKCQSEKEAARKAKQYTVQALRSARSIELRNMERGKYFRVLSDVYMDGRNLSDALIEAGYARSYDGGKRMGWCE
jgi:endonuclease YncB( thermonuclease family)